MEAQGSSTWNGTRKEGASTISTARPGPACQAYSYASRFEGTPGASPEELLAAAHAGCFSRVLANNFGMQALTARAIDTSLTIDLGQHDQGRPAVLGSHIGSKGSWCLA